MDFLGILQALKGKVLDASHFDLLKHAYELQDQNLTQLKHNNDALKESNDLLKEKTARLEADLAMYQARIAELELAATPSASPDYRPSSSAVSILEYCLKHDVTDFLAEEMIQRLPCSKIEVSAGIDELQQQNMVDLSSVGMGGSRYFLTPKGQRFVLAMRK
ncbi:MAG: hypothetical protein ACYC7B_04650 [Burkholderiales bacterium]